MDKKYLEKIYHQTERVTDLPFPIFAEQDVKDAIEDALDTFADKKAADLIQKSWNTRAGRYDSLDLLLSWFISYKLKFFDESGTLLGEKCLFDIDRLIISDRGASTTDEMAELLAENPPHIGYNDLEIPFVYMGRIMKVSSISCQNETLSFCLKAEEETENETPAFTTVFRF